MLDGIEVVVAVDKFTFAPLPDFEGVPGVDRELWFGLLLLILLSLMSSYKRQPVQTAVWEAPLPSYFGSSGKEYRSKLSATVYHDEVSLHLSGSFLSTRAFSVMMSEREGEKEIER